MQQRSTSSASGALKFLEHEAAGGLVLLAAAILALIFANTGLSRLYDAFLDTPVVIQIGALKLAKPLLLWINDGLMAVFFFHVGLELKRAQGATWLSFYGVAILAGIGFTMSLFIGSLAFHKGLEVKPAVDERVGILLGSVLSAVVGYAVLRTVLRR